MVQNVKILFNGLHKNSLLAESYHVRLSAHMLLDEARAHGHDRVQMIKPKGGMRLIGSA